MARRRRSAPRRRGSRLSGRLSVGLVSPLPPTRSGIADYAQELLAPLGTAADVATYVPAKAAAALGAGHDVLLFQIGNDPLHAPSVEALESPERKAPAVVVLHDFVLHHLYAAAWLDRGRERDYAELLAKNHGEKGRRLGERALAGTRVPVWDLDPWSYPMSGSVLRAADAVIVHSRLVRGAVLRERPRLDVALIPHHVAPAPRTPRDEARARFGVPPGRRAVATLGIVTPAKRIDKLLDALARLAPGERPFLLVGGAIGPDDALREKVAALGLSGDVLFTGYLDDAAFWRAASAADVAANLRFPTMGETSGAVCRLAGLGLPVIVSDVGWFRELPDDFAWKIPVGGDEVERLAAVLSTAGSEPEGRVRSRAAEEWGRARSPAATAERYLDVLSRAASGLSRLSGFRSGVSYELHRLGAGTVGRARHASREPDALAVARTAGAMAELWGDRLAGQSSEAGPSGK